MGKYDIQGLLSAIKISESIFTVTNILKTNTMTCMFNQNKNFFLFFLYIFQEHNRNSSKLLFTIINLEKMTQFVITIVRNKTRLIQVSRRTQLKCCKYDNSERRCPITIYQNADMPILIQRRTNPLYELPIEP